MLYPLVSLHQPIRTHIFSSTHTIPHHLANTFYHTQAHILTLYKPDSCSRNALTVLDKSLFNHGPTQNHTEFYVLNSKFYLLDFVVLKNYS